jgi:hypothetical protein
LLIGRNDRTVFHKEREVGVKRMSRVLVLIFCFGGMLGSLGAEERVLSAMKDSFGRSQERTRNSGASQELYVAHASSVRTIIAYDLSSVTNRITAATLRFQQKTSMSSAVALTIAPMVQTDNNLKWNEGSGGLGTKGQNARPGESCYGWSAFSSVPWENSDGAAVTDLASEGLWGAPLVRNKSLSWEDGAWVEIKITNLEALDAIRESEHPILTLGLWGTSGSGLYAFASKESGRGPELVLVLEEHKGDSK